MLTAPPLRARLDDLPALARVSPHQFGIALRTCVLKDGKLYIQAGGGVVADSGGSSSR